MSAFLLGLAGLAVGLGLGWLARRPTTPPAAPDPLDGLEADALWARRGDRWTRLAREGGRWVPRETEQGAPVRFPRSTSWVAGQLEREAVSDALGAWTDACAAASEVPWAVGLPTGPVLLGRWAEGAPPTEQPARDFSRWLIGALGRSGREGLRVRGDAERRGVALTRVHRAAAALVSALDPELALELAPRGGVGPREADRWLVDEDLARALGNPPVAGVVQPVVVLRPRLVLGDRTLLEGEVA